MIHSSLHPVFGVAAIACMALVACDSDDGGTGPSFTCQANPRDTVDFTAVNTQQSDTITVGEVSVTGSAAVSMVVNGGLGIVGGYSDNYTDGAEFIRFTFDSGPADSVSYHVWLAGSPGGSMTVGKATVEAFDQAGASLGVDSVVGVGVKDVSEAFDHVPLSGFTVTARGDFFRIGVLWSAPCH